VAREKGGTPSGQCSPSGKGTAKASPILPLGKYAKKGDSRKKGFDRLRERRKEPGMRRGGGEKKTFSHESQGRARALSIPLRDEGTVTDLCKRVDPREEGGFLR